MGKPAIGIDVDDVLVDLNRPLQQWHNVKYGTNNRYSDITDYFLAPRWGCTLAEAVRRCNEFCFSAAHGAIGPVEGAREALNRLRKRHTLVAITSRPEELKQITCKLLWRHGLMQQLDSMIFLGHFHRVGEVVRSKAEVCQDISAVCCIEDGLPHVTSLSAAGVPVLVFDRPWNQGALPPHATRVFNWADVLRVVG